ncbi:MAG: SGNH/GDSL hydrolase family protein [Candidatus Caldatribacteriota bacterium]|jgi:lysophospholipase L1-like esterase|nr:SGNH/GDSL hydrolase family protein [Atribacterota bacterium]MDD3640736.1 SGNH/GDSL hydrolase family protein [Atribacterota bacterium]MDD4289100.1 SGNH/GDSL hydrolase family protein [Atribacterota bacterium]MDD4764780.1 SGNH/GDSL hydrolase family protein [Atribacterota bacterium]MDI9597692.1 SGNH/GDSL hydrolase family protein [Atribacterota bacterium]
MLKRILCFGNSNTWGYIPGLGKRYDSDERWTGIMALELGKEYQIIEEGLNGRTIASEDPNRPGRNGIIYLVPCLETHSPLDIVILFLGTNDLKDYYKSSVHDIAVNMEKMIRLIKNVQFGSKGMAPEVLLISNPHISENVLPDSPFQNASKKSKRLISEYKKIAIVNHCHFLDISSNVKVSPIDGVHLDEENHNILAGLLIKEIKKIEKNSHNIS